MANGPDTTNDANDVTIGKLNNPERLKDYAAPMAPMVKPAVRVRVTLECQECHAHWRVSPNANDLECPDCGSTDYEVL